MSGKQGKRLQSTRRLVPSGQRKRALFSCDRCKLRKTKCNRIQNNDLKYDNITPCLQCTKAGVSCTTSIPRKKRFYGPVKNITLHYKCLLALVTGLFPDSDIYNIEELVDIGHKLKFDMPNLDVLDDTNPNNNPNGNGDGDLDSESFEQLKKESNRLQEEQNIVMKYENENDNDNDNDNKVEKEDDTEKAKGKSDYNGVVEMKNTDFNIPNNEIKNNNENSNTNKTSASSSVKSSNFNNNSDIPKLPPSVKIRHSNVDSERLIMDRFGHTHFIGNFGTASLLNGLCDIIIKRSYNQKNPPTSTQDIRDSSVQTITSENIPVYQYPTHLYNLDAMNIDRFPLINIVDRPEADVYVNTFFQKVHPYYFIFNENHFLDKYEIFWDELNVNSKNNSSSDLHEKNKPQLLRLNSAEICSIYTVWILGRRFQQFSDPENLPKNAVLDEEMMGKLIDIIKLSLSDVVLTPSIDGIRLLILFSVYLSSIKVRESGYCLMELAAIQAKSLGLHRKSIVNKFNDQKSDVMKRILWSLTKAETTLCCSFGRASAIPWEEIDIDFPDIDDESDEHFKIYYLESCKLTKIIFEILDYKKKTQKDPLSLISIEKALYFKNKLEIFWNNLPPLWRDYKSLPIKRYKPKLHIQYYYYYITLTLPMFLCLVNSPNYIVKNTDPFLSLLVWGIQSSFKTAEIVSYTDSKGFFNGTIYYDVFYCYNAIMVLTLSYILFKSSQTYKTKHVIDLDNLNDKYKINLEEILKSINLIRKLVLKNLHKIDGTMKRMSDIIETLLEDLGIIQTLVKKYNAPPSNVKNIEDKNESGNTSVTSIPTSYRKIKLQLNKTEKKKRTAKNLQSSKPVSFDDSSLNNNNKVRKTDSNIIKMKRVQSTPIETSSQQNNFINDNKTLNSELPSNMLKSYSTEAVNLSSDIKNKNKNNQTASLFQFNESAVQNSTNTSSTNLFAQGYIQNSDLTTDESRTNTGDINDVLSSMSLNTDLMDALFGTDLFNMNDDTLF